MVINVGIKKQQQYRHLHDGNSRRSLAHINGLNLDFTEKQCYVCICCDSNNRVFSLLKFYNAIGH